MFGALTLDIITTTQHGLPNSKYLSCRVQPFYSTTSGNGKRLLGLDTCISNKCMNVFNNATSLGTTHAFFTLFPERKKPSSIGILLNLYTQLTRLQEMELASIRGGQQSTLSIFLRCFQITAGNSEERIRCGRSCTKLTGRLLKLLIKDVYHEGK